MRRAFRSPTPLLYCADESVAGTPFYVMGYRRGPRVLGAATCRSSTPAERAAVYDAMNATLARLHAFDPAAIGLGDFGRGENYVARQVERWSKQYRASRDRTHRRDGAADRVAAGASAAGRRRCGWCMATTGSTTSSWTPSGPKVLAVLDWELSTLGDPLADFAYHLMQWDMPPSETGAGIGTLVGLDLAALGIPSRGGLCRRLCARAPGSIRGRTCRSISPTISSASPRSCRASSGRVRDGTATNENAAGMALMVRPLADKAWRFAREAGAA